MDEFRKMHRGQFIDTLAEGDRVLEYYRVARKSVRQTRRGDLYLDLTLADRTGMIAARLFGDRDGVHDRVTSYAAQFKPGDVIRVDGRVDRFQGKLQLLIDRLRVSENGEVDGALFEKSSDRPFEEMERELAEKIEAIENRYLKKLVESVFGSGEIKERFLVAPAATRIHHAYRHGLLEHTLSMIAGAEALHPLYPELDLDLLRAAILFHDVGKTAELGEKAGDDYTVEGTLEGHIYIGARWVDEAAGKIDGFPGELRLQLIHLILSHHGEREYGAPVVPATREAVFLHQLDNLDAKLANVRQTIAADRNSQSPFTDPAASGPIYRRYYKGASSGSKDHGGA